MCNAVDPVNTESQPKVILNQLLDKNGRLLSYHRQSSESGATAEITIFNNKKLV
jgi:hypothetical protein